MKADKHAVQALADLTSVCPASSELPVYSLSELTMSPFCDKNDSFDIHLTVSQLEEVINSETLAWVAFQVQLARYSPESESAAGVSLQGTLYKTIFDDVQLTQVEATP